eukprot:s161_g5.t1
MGPGYVIEDLSQISTVSILLVNRNPAFSCHLGDYFCGNRSAMCYCYSQKIVQGQAASSVFWHSNVPTGFEQQLEIGAFRIEA